ncbi:MULTISPECIES: LysR family transcriptional regulator [Phyllobacteriaceae]|jgi:DNA-binding transcriptional LysR family regulator|uniref:LysR family transcriptional regulator n=1 Tax=Mesorhizobium hungaricum TaxID=1566387 RepID=A0A1C2DNW3_9HYPH|nr:MULTISPECIES: LysR family transcriptional regulator [Mesorhizobium]MBN9233607.1 LysR family transcriptional regulator [Mesorhizobium sp.]MDQ0328585.1 DNA-binding transcriptional LysR family regulator [Mesorhizobium sp. YL-MeA3-2017]OCX16468.1 LysR family transcriptional regulator [Mesorhizobium hungaricum]
MTTRIDTNRLGEMDVFVRVVELCGFSPAARALRLSPSGVSKLITRLETRLGTRLFNRSTRKLALTAEGSIFYDRCVQILADVDGAEREAAAGAVPRGRLRVNCNVAFSQWVLTPVLPDFLARYPEIVLDLVVSDVVVDLLQEHADVAIRIGPLANSSLIARKLGASRAIVVAAPAYLDQMGTPREPADLARHNLLGFGFSRLVEGWPFLGENGQVVRVAPQGNVLVSDGDTMRRLAVEGVGIARVARFQLEEDLATGRLVQLLEDYSPGEVEPIHAVYVGQGGVLPARVRAFLDFLTERVKVR